MHNEMVVMLLGEFILDSRERSIKAFLDLVILHLLSKHAMSGYEINKALVKKFGLMVGPSTIYSKLSTFGKTRIPKLCKKQVRQSLQFNRNWKGIGG